MDRFKLFVFLFTLFFETMAILYGILEPLASMVMLGYYPISYLKMATFYLFLSFCSIIFLRCVKPEGSV